MNLMVILFEEELIYGWYSGRDPLERQGSLMVSLVYSIQSILLQVYVGMWRSFEDEGDEVCNQQKNTWRRRR